MNHDKLEFVSAIIVNKNGNVLLLKRRKTLKLDPEKYDMCSGHMKKGEVPMQSMLRELSEELGIQHDEIKKMDNLGEIKTPHLKFQDTITHMYLVEIDLSKEELNQNIKELKSPEIESVQYLENLTMLKNVQKYTNFMRTIYTEEQEEVFEVAQEKLNERKEYEVKLCQEGK